MSPALIAAFIVALCGAAAVFMSVYAASQTKTRRKP